MIYQYMHFFTYRGVGSIAFFVMYMITCIISELHNHTGTYYIIVDYRFVSIICVSPDFDQRLDLSLV